MRHMPQSSPRGRAFSIGVIAALAGVLAPPAAAGSCPPESAIRDYVYAGGLCLGAETFGAEEAGASPLLIVVVHGDISDGGAATYHARFARTLARPGAVVVALWRPGYPDGRGRISQGRDYGREDNYTAANIAAVAAAT